MLPTRPLVTIDLRGKERDSTEYSAEQRHLREDLIPRQCAECTVHVTACVGGFDVCLTHIWRSKTHHPERIGQRCCMLHGSQRYTQYRFENGDISQPAPRGVAIRAKAI